MTISLTRTIASGALLSLLFTFTPLSVRADAPAQASVNISRIGGITLPNFTNGIGLASSGSYLYAVDAGAGHQFNVISIANPSAPVIVGTASDLFSLNGAFTVKIQGMFAFVTANGSNKLVVIDISTPTAPKVVASLADSRFGNPRGLELAGSYAYVIGNSQPTFTVVDIHNPTAPVVVGSVTNSAKLASGDSIALFGNYAYVTAGDSNALTIINIATPTNPVIVGSVSDLQLLGNAKELTVDGKYAYVTALASNSLVVVDISNPAAPKIVGSVQDSTKLYGPKNLAMSGQHAYVSTNNGHTLTVINISQPTAPVISAVYNDAKNLYNARGVVVLPQATFVLAGNILNAFQVTFTSVVSTSTTPSASITSAQIPVANGNTVVSGQASGTTALTVIAYPSTDYDTVSYRNNQVPVTNGQWSVSVPFSKGTYVFEVHTSSLTPSAKTFLGYKYLTTNPATQAASLR